MVTSTKRIWTDIRGPTFAMTILITLAFVIPWNSITTDTVSACTIAGAGSVYIPANVDDGPVGPVPVRGVAAGCAGVHRARSSSTVPEEDLDYVIITDSRFVGSFEPLEEWKASKGFRTEIIPLNGSLGIISTTEGRDTAERIHNYLVALKDKNPGLTWVLLGGDSEIIPSRKLFTASNTNYSYTDDRNFCYGDIYYSGLDSSWDTNQNGIYGEMGEEDIEADVIIGRLPVSTAAEANTVVDKIIAYEKDPPTGGWQRSVLLAGALMDMPNVIDDPATPQDEGFDAYKDNAREVCLKIKDDLPSQIVPFELYDYDHREGKQYSKMYDALNRTNFQHYYDLGHSSVLIASHGMAVNGDFLSDYVGSSGGTSRDDFSAGSNALVYYKDADILGKNSRLPFIYASACSVGNFTQTDDSDLETFITSHGGAIGMVAATNETWRLEFEENDTSYGNWWLARQFYQYLYHSDTRPAQVLNRVREDYETHWSDPANPHLDDVKFNNYYRTDLLAYNYLGDPETKIWTNTTHHLNISTPDPFMIQNRSMDILVLDEQGVPVENALVSVRECSNDTILLRGVTEEDGYVHFSTKDRTPGDGPLMIAAYADNALLSTRQIALSSYTDIYFGSLPVPEEEFPTVGDEVGVLFTVNATGLTEPLWLNASITIVQGTSRYTENTSCYLNGSEGARPPVKLIADMDITKVTISLDPDQAILEWNETNNIASVKLRGNVPVSIHGIPDMLLDEDTSTQDEPLLAIDLQDYSSDPDGWPQPLVYSVQCDDEGCNVSIDDELRVQVIPDRDWFGTSNVTILVTDGAYEDSDEFTIRVIPVDDAPTLPRLSNYTATQNQAFSLPIEATDVDSEVLNFTSDGELYLLAPDAHDPHRVWINFTPTNDDVGLHFTRITVMDDKGLNDTRTIPIMVMNVNDPPIILTHESIRKGIGDRVFMVIRIDDPDNNDRHTFYSDDAMIPINSSTGVIEFVANASQKGRHEVTITVVDINGTNDTATIVIDIVSGSGPTRWTLAFIVGMAGLILGGTYLITAFGMRRGGKRERGAKDALVPEYEEMPREGETPIQSTIKRMGLRGKRTERDIYLDDDVDEVISQKISDR